MNNNVGFLDYNCKMNLLKKMLAKIFFFVDVKKIEETKYSILLTSKKISKNKNKKIINKLKKEGICTVAIANEYSFLSEHLKVEGFKVLTGKIVAKYMVEDIIRYLSSVKNIELSNEALYVAIDNDRNIDIILDIAKHFKYLSIVTSNIKKFKRLHRKLEKNNDLLYSMSNNTIKSLKNAKFLINFDYGDEFFSRFKIRKELIIINLSDNILNIKKGFSGIIVERIDLKANNYFFQNKENSSFNNDILCESEIFYLTYFRAREYIQKHRLSIDNLYGINGKISTREIIENNP